MKTKNILIIAICLITTTAQAQFDKVRFNPKVGVNASTLNTELDQNQGDAEGRIGYQVGADLRLESGAFFLSPGFHFVEHTAELFREDELDNLTFEETTRIRSFKVPLNMGVYLTGDRRDGVLHVYLKGGVTPVFLSGVKEAANFSLTEDDITQTNWELNAGLGIDLLFGNFEINYGHGLRNYFTNADGKNRVLSVSLGLNL